MLNGKPVVLLDCDDVVARCINGMARIAGSFLGRDITEEDVKTWDFHKSFGDEDLKQHIYEKMSEKGWCLSLEPFEGAIEGVHELQKISEVFFITSPFHSEHWEFERRAWLLKHFGFKKDRILQGSAKFLVRGEFFVDDKPDHVRQWMNGSHWGTYPYYGLPCLWDRPHNKEAKDLDTYRIHSWDELHLRVREGIRRNA
jgi:5'(3')-deoxyribonucleotidase